MNISTHDALRALYDQPPERSIKKELSALEVHSRRFIELSPFVVLATADGIFNMDASPRGGAPGFVKVVDDRTMLIPDAPGNNRLDTLHNVVATGRIGLLFLIPGFDETLRVNGSAVLSQHEDDIDRCTDERARAETGYSCHRLIGVSALREGVSAFKTLVARGAPTTRAAANDRCHAQ